MKRQLIALIILFILISILISPLLFFNIHVRTSSETYTFDDYEIKVIYKQCINCSEGSVKKKIYITEGNKTTFFNLDDSKYVPEDLDTPIIIGRSRRTSKFKESNIDDVVFFPSNLEHIETYNYLNGDCLNDLEDGSFMWSYYNQNGMVNNIRAELNVRLDTILKYDE